MKIMNNNRYAKLIISIALLLVLLASFAVANAQDGDDEEHAEEVHWGYAGEEGPDNWGALSEAWAACSEGTAQSPIDVSDTTGVDLVNIDFAYDSTALNIFNNGHTIQVNVDEGNSIVYNGISYNLLQFHFHQPSEHTVDGEAAPMEIHFVHQDPASGNLAVVGVLLMAGEEDNAGYTAIFDNLPAEEGEPEASDISVDLNGLLPDQQTFYTYQGSLTTPPCSEIVRWLLLDTPVALSAGQVEAFGAIYDNNARPVQPLGERDLLVDTDE